MNKLRRFLRMPIHIKWMCLEAVVLSAWYSFRVQKRPFSELAAEMGGKNQETSSERLASSVPLAVATVADRVCRHMPWKSECLVRALVARRMLLKRSFASTLYMGVRMENGELKAHAWLRCGDLYVTGGTGAGYTVTGMFGEVKE